MSARPVDARSLPVESALILAAGRGARLGELTRAVPKPLASLGDTTLLERQLDQLEACGVRRVTVVAGYRAERIRALLGRRRDGLRVEVVRNTEWASSGSAWSLVRAAEALRAGEPVLLLHGELAFDDALLDDLLTAGATSTVLDRTRRPTRSDAALGWTRDGALAGVRKVHDESACGPVGEGEHAGEFVGMTLLGPSFAWGFVDSCVARTAADRRLDYEPLLSEFVSQGRERCGVSFVDGAFWRGVSELDDLRAARERFGGALEAS